MKPEQILIISGGHWHLLRDGNTVDIEPWSVVTSPTVVFFSLEKSQTGLLSSKGKANYAGALIEKEIRSSGAIDGSVKVFVHMARGQGESVQALYTAVSLDAWQELQNWSGRQNDHCILIPAASLLCTDSKNAPTTMLDALDNASAFAESSFSGFQSSTFGSNSSGNGNGNGNGSRNSTNSNASTTEKPGALLTAPLMLDKPASVRACRIDNEVLVFADYQDRLYFNQVTLLGQDDYDIVPAVRALIGQFPVKEWGMVVDGFDWATFCAHSLDDEKQLAARAAQAFKLPCRLMATQKYSGEDAQIHTSLFLMSQDMLLQNKNVPALAKVSWMSESWTIPVTAVAGLVCALAVGAGFYFQQQVASQQTMLAGQKSEYAKLQNRLEDINRENTPLLNDPQLAFAAKITEAAMYDPARMLELFKRGAGPNIRVQRIQLFLDETSARRAYRVEGVIADGANTDIARFVSTLKAAGWQATPTKSADSSIKAFAYIFKPTSTEAF